MASVARLEEALRIGDLDMGIPAVDLLLGASEELLAEIDQSPTRDLGAEAELVAALRVFRNAAFAYRRVVGATGDPDPSKAEICEAMIEQGKDHYQRYTISSCGGSG